jgi:hypothetical protein
MRRTMLSLVLGLAAVIAIAQPAFATISFTDPSYPWPVVPATYVAGPAPGTQTTTTAAFAATGLVTVSDCNDILTGPQTDLVKQAQRIDNTDGTVTLKIQLTTTRAASDSRLRDCLWIDSNGNSQWDVATETLYAVDIQPFAFLADPTGPGSFARFRVTVTATAQDRICDRAARSEYQDAAPPQTPYIDKSNTLCLDGSPNPVVPESALVVLLPLSALVIGGGVFYVRRRTRLIAATA